MTECLFLKLTILLNNFDLFMNTHCFLSCSFKSLKSANSTFGLFGGDLGEVEGVFLHVDDNDIIAEEMGDTRAEDLAEYSRWASLSILM